MAALSVRPIDALDYRTPRRRRDPPVRRPAVTQCSNSLRNFFAFFSDRSIS
jgi:hypothetical protein